MIQSHPFVLASASPQRSTLLSQMGLEFSVHPVDMDEDHRKGEDARELVRLLAREKLELRLNTPGEYAPDSCILAADTIVALDSHRLGKPADAGQAEEFLGKLSGREHQVLTGLAIYLPASISADIPALEEHTPGEIQCAPPDSALNPDFASGIIAVAHAVTNIALKNLDTDEIRAYLDWGEYEGAAGGYRVQGRAGCFLTGISGSYTNVVGLPIELLYAILRRTSFWQ
ncbi:Maf family protein [Salinispira pacifica]|uniref:Nucleoside triphosphate pyrophosphatase n=1 Tax=Salinispira pacifica TaxID=1307761 RepID=V5WGP9_9SPIO|nr:Maf family protein [Salinispira pacifica]AHC14729.1 Septum formation protein Maf [Salinispira pacifica]